MPQTKVVMGVRHISPEVSIIDILGDVIMLAKQLVMGAYEKAASPTTCTIILNFSEMEYLNSSGISLLIVLLRRAHGQKQRLLCYGLSEHYRHMLILTHLNDLIPIYENEAEALAAAM